MIKILGIVDQLVKENKLQKINKVKTKTFE